MVKLGLRAVDGKRRPPIRHWTKEMSQCWKQRKFRWYAESVKLTGAKPNIISSGQLPRVIVQTCSRTPVGMTLGPISPVRRNGNERELVDSRWLRAKREGSDSLMYVVIIDIFPM